MSRFIVIALMLAGLLQGGLAPATTLQVDPANVNGTTIFASLNDAGEYLVNNTLDVDGNADSILVMVDNLDTTGTTNGAFRYQGTDDLTVDGDGNSNGVWCTLLVAPNDTFNGVGNTDDSFFRIENEDTTAWNATVVIRNFIMVPYYVSAGAVTVNTSNGVHAVYSHALGTNLATAGRITVENVIVTGSLPGNATANPFLDQAASVTRFSRGIFTRNKNETTAAQADTTTTFRNMVIAFLDNEAIRYSGDNEVTTFGPGFIESYIDGGNINVVASDAQYADIRFEGAANNRNLFIGNGTVAGDIVINADGAATTKISKIAYTDFISNPCYRMLRGHIQTLLIDNIILSESGTSSGGNGHFDLFAADSGPLVVSNSTFYNMPASTTYGKSIYANSTVPSMRLSNCIFAAGANENATTSASTDQAFMADNAIPTTATSCLFPEVGPYALRSPYDSTFPPSPAADAGYLVGTNIALVNCANINPNFVSTNLADYPLPATVAAWQAKKISLIDQNTLLPVNYLLPDSDALKAANISGAHPTAVPVELATFSLE